MSFTFSDLFAGIGGFHAALAAQGGECVFVSEIDEAAKAVYERNWGSSIERRPGRPVLEGDITTLTDPFVQHVPKHDVLAGGFPCQPFSKSGYQRGIAETRGTLFFNIARILQEQRPAVVMLENVRNLAGPRHRDTWATIVRTLRELGYRVSATPTVFSPHLLPPALGGTPQVRDRVFIMATHIGLGRPDADYEAAQTLPYSPVAGWDPMTWDLDQHLLQDDVHVDLTRYGLTTSEQSWFDVWDDFVGRLLEHREGVRLPGFPLWADAFVADAEIPAGTPAWKADFLRKNSEFYVQHKDVVDNWLADHPEFAGFPPSRRKLEWQAQGAPNLRSTVLQLRPSGVRAKRPTYLPALVAITHTSVIGSRGRRITPVEAARLQGLPDWFDFGSQPDAATYKQLGNGVAVGAAAYVFRTHVENDPDVPAHIKASVRASSDAPVVPRPAEYLAVA